MPPSSALAAHAPGHVAEAGDGQALALQGLALVLQHPGQEVNGAEAGGLLADHAAAVGQALAGQGAALRPAGEALVLAEEVADLPGAHADVTGGDVGVGADVAVQGRHEALAEAHDLPAALAPGIEVRAAGGAADGQPRQGRFCRSAQSPGTSR